MYRDVEELGFLFCTNINSNFARIAALAALATVAAAAPAAVTCPTGQSTANAACCALFPIVDRLQAELFHGGECGEEAHSALRLSLHDAIGFSIHGEKGGGADGSILAFKEPETAFHANLGIAHITNQQWPLFKESGLSAGDFVHLAGAVGTANCPGAPRLQYFLGRPAPLAPAPDLTVPEPTDTVTTILARFADAGFSPAEVIALLSSHTIQAATDGIFDTQIFLDVLLKGTISPVAVSQPGQVPSPFASEARLQSDFALAHDPRTACFWQAMLDNQTHMVNSFSAAMAKMQVLGQNTTTRWTLIKRGATIQADFV